jgi:hypothetical protein
MGSRCAGTHLCLAPKTKEGFAEVLLNSLIRMHLLRLSSRIFSTNMQLLLGLLVENVELLHGGRLKFM